jgi:hypothetical protein
MPITKETSRPKSVSVRHLTKDAAKNGELKVLKRLDKEGRIKREYLIDEYGAIYQAASYGHLDVLKWIWETYAPLKSELFDTVLCDVGRRDYFSTVLEWFRDVVGLSKADAGILDKLLHYAALGGHLEAIKWTYYKFNLTPDYLRRNKNEILRCAACHGSLNVLMWLDDVCQLTADDFKYGDHYDDYEAVRMAIHNGQVETIYWMSTAMKLDIIVKELLGECKGRINCIVWKNVESGNLQNLRYIYELSPGSFDNKTVFTRESYIYRATKNGHLEVAEWLKYL